MRTLRFFSRCRLAAFSAVFTGLAIAASMLAPFAHAQTLAFSLTCGGANSTAYSPGITDTNQSITFTSSQTYSCLPIAGHPQLTGGAANASGTYSVSCLDLLQTGFPPSDATYQWNDGTQSVVRYTTSIVSYNPAGDLQIVQTGSVLSGTGQGAAATETITLLNYGALQFQDACLSAQGLRSASGPVVLSFVEVL